MINRFKETICSNLLKLRRAHNYSQQYVGRVLSISQPAYKKMENGVTNINACQLGALAGFYGVPVQRFYSDTMMLDDDADEMKERWVQLKEQLHNTNMLLEVYRKRIAELEAKVARKDAKIEDLRSKTGDYNHRLSKL
ncbi:Helix-turn-helix [Parapedobacter composti]|uniref:Helix-turn-helix n=1 Tax=Parapedobacter composti TaxID=623281 RepID=A0A1I1M1P9_9SPHI|nr:helix-turn-helix transcriptional regulator [Parapedobacter composti]SFC79304.1 Helix-turn-helix [Parapedobacter composti]